MFAGAMAAALPSARAAQPGDDGEAEARSKHFPFGPVVPPRPVPSLAVMTSSGEQTDLQTLFSGRVSAVQLMFTGCSATCPIQGALFAQAQRRLGAGLPDVQFVSISIDPLGDSPAALAAWLEKFDAAPGWLALQPGVDDVGTLFTVLGEGGEPRPTGRDPHTGQVYFIDRHGALVLRTPSLPPATQIIDGIRMVAALK
jgi:protein SCO1/2